MLLCESARVDVILGRCLHLYMAPHPSLDFSVESHDHANRGIGGANAIVAPSATLRIPKQAIPPHCHKGQLRVSCSFSCHGANNQELSRQPRAFHSNAAEHEKGRSSMSSRRVE